MKKFFGTKIEEKVQVGDILGNFTLSETQNIHNFASHAFYNAIHKVGFHTGILERELFELLGKTSIQAEMKTDGFAYLVWSLYFDKPIPVQETKTDELSNNQSDPPVKKKSLTLKSCLKDKEKESKDTQIFYVQEETKLLEGGFMFTAKFRVGDEFLIIMPITGEKIKSVVKRRSNPKAVDGVYYEQTTNFPNGNVDAIYTKTESGGLKINLHHPASRTSAELIFRKA